MDFLLNLIPAPYRIMAGLAGLVFLFTLGFGVGVKATVNHYKPKLATEKSKFDAEKLRADANESAYLTLAKLTKTQNDSITTLKLQGEEREKVAIEAVKIASQNAKKHEDKAAYYKSLVVPEVSKQCDYAKGLLNDYVKDRIRSITSNDSSVHY